MPAKRMFEPVYFEPIKKTLYQGTTSVVPQKPQMMRALAPAALFPSLFCFAQPWAAQAAIWALPL
jgi:hypothetical protein